jgi:hypothetical protein
MKRSDLVSLLRTQKIGVVSTIAADGSPRSAVVGVAITDDLEIVFDTLESTRKAENLRRDARVAMVIGMDDWTFQSEGLADEPRGVELEALKQCYYAAYPDGPARLSWQGLIYVRVRLHSARLTDYRDEGKITELGALEG